tara:strand:+ start:199 stop:1119 length:921 start_codon:yes stop_codon:yes gene_type:complete
MYGRPNFTEDAHSIYPAKGTKAYQGFEINETLFQGKSPYQDVAIYTNDALGKVLVLDGIVQITTADEFVYQEMMAHVPVFSCPNEDKNVLIIGGGDGGILREVLRHNSVKKAVMAEIDQMVIDACTRHMPEINNGGKVYEDPKAELIVGDAFDYVRKTDIKFDAVIIDSTDPIGPGEKLFSDEFYRNLSKILTEDAFIATQGGVPFFQPGEAAGTLASLNKAGLRESCYIAAVPTYYGGYMTLGFASNTKREELLPNIETLKEAYAKEGFATKHYSPEMHLASFVLPPWIKQDIEGQKQNDRKEAA